MLLRKSIKFYFSISNLQTSSSCSSERRWHRETLQNTATWWRWFLHRPPHHIQVFSPLNFFIISVFNFSLIRRTLQELVEHYSKDSDGLCVNLCKPCVQVIIHSCFCKLHSPSHSFHYNYCKNNSREKKTFLSYHISFSFSFFVEAAENVDVAAFWVVSFPQWLFTCFG